VSRKDGEIGTRGRRRMERKEEGEGTSDLITLRYSDVRRHSTGEQKKILKDLARRCNYPVPQIDENSKLRNTARLITIFIFRVVCFTAPTVDKRV
jgi:hypothetical protein